MDTKAVSAVNVSVNLVSAAIGHLHCTLPPLSAVVASIGPKQQAKSTNVALLLLYVGASGK